MSTTLLWFRQLLRRLLSSGLVRHTVHGLVQLWRFLKHCYAWIRPRQDARPRGGGSSCGGPRLSGEASSRGEGSTRIIYASKEPAALAAGNYLEQAREQARASMFLSPGDPGSRPASRPTSAHYQKDSDDDDQYPISVQTASSSRPSQNGSQLSLGSHQQRARASVYGDHLAPSSRASSRASVRVSNRLSTYVTPEDSHRRRGRSRSRARSPVRNPANSRPRPESAISIHDKASLRSRTNAAPPAGSPPAPLPPFPVNRSRRKQRLYPVMQTHRYDRGTKLQERTFEYTIEPMQMSYPLEGAPDLWEAHTHPEGALYFRHRHRRIYTEAWLCDPEVLDEIEDFLVHLDETTYTSGCMLPPDAELVLELENIPPNANEHNDLETNKPAKHYWTYYYVNHASRLLFWVQSHEVSAELEVLRGFHSSSHIKHGIEEFYWRHFEYFPHGQTVSKTLIDEVLSMLVYKTVDQLTSASSTVGMKPDEIQKLASMIKTAKSLGSNQYTACAVGRLMSIFAHDRYHYYYGQKVARLDRYQSLFDDTKRGKRTALAALLSPVLFNAPEVHLKSLERIWVDQIINEIPWSQFINKLQTDWQEAVLTATVLLNANISFMTINDVDSGTGPRTPAQIASFVSTIASIAATVIGMLLVRQYRVKPKETALDAVTYLTSRRHPKLGLETLAIMYSLPYALLMWAVVTFLVAFALECFHIRDIPTISVTATTWAIAAMLLVLCLYTIWEGGDISVHQWFMDVWESTQSRLRPYYARVMRKHSGAGAATPEQSSATASPEIAMEAC